MENPVGLVACVIATETEPVPPAVVMLGDAGEKMVPGG